MLRIDGTDDGCDCGAPQEEAPALTRRALLGGALGAALLAAVPAGAVAARSPLAPPAVADVTRVDPRAVTRRYAGIRPASWGTALPGVLGRAPVRTVVVRGRRHPVACLTFDACGNPAAGSASNGFDEELVDFLRERRVQATLFISKRWATARPRLAAALAKDPLFEIGNHGTLHRPVTVDGRAAYGVAGSPNAAEAVREVWESTLHLQRLVGRRPTLFRSGTAHYDDVGVAIVRALGQLPVGFGTNADFGATASAATVEGQLRGLVAGGISLAHFNRPHGSTAEGVRAAVPRLRDAGFVFRKVSAVLR
jgi:peptidoglycan/xylan/chitin deacetylase (PgdA/CDA1 family)